ncbi:MAG TPA: hypothetical protein VFS24_10100 [Steroidobacteraceae bacterium]|nr:hypothetical protein [Steroidobacteraceae bacterium]
MTDFFWPPDIVPSDVEWRLLDSTGVFSSPLSGTVRTVSRPGTNRWGVRMSFQNLKDSQRYRLMSLIALLRGQSNRIWIPDVSSVRRGSFPASELLSNNTFASGTTGWSANSQANISVQDRILRLQVTAHGPSVPQFGASPEPSFTPYAPHVFRVMLQQSSRANVSAGAFISDGSIARFTYSTTHGLHIASIVPNVTTCDTAIVYDSTDNTSVARDYVLIPYTSLSRCALVDNAPNLLTRSDEIDHADWAKVGVTISANNTVAPDGSLTMDGLIEDTNNTAHMVTQNKTGLSSSVTDYSVYAEVTPGNRSFAFLQMDEGGATTVTQYFNLTTGAVGSGSTGAGWSDRRAAIINMGDSRFFVMMAARKTTSATSVKGYIGAASADGTATYVGNGSGTAIAIRRCGLAPSATFTRGGQTVSSALPSGTTQSGSALYLRGLPVSTNGVLEAGDMFQVGNEIKRATARLNTDAAGFGYLPFEPALRASLADMAPVIFHEPMGKFLLNTSDVVWPTRAGLFSDFSLDFVEAVGN